MTTTINLETTLKEFLVSFNGLILKPKKDYFIKFNDATLNNIDYLDLEEFGNLFVLFQETKKHILFTLESPLSSDINKLFEYFECIDVKVIDL